MTTTRRKERGSNTIPTAGAKRQCQRLVRKQQYTLSQPRPTIAPLRPIHRRAQKPCRRGPGRKNEERSERLLSVERVSRETRNDEQAKRRRPPYFTASEN